MPPVGKLSSVLAQFEHTIEQNNAAGVASGMYLTKLASSSKDSLAKPRSRSNNTLSTASSHSSKKSGNEHSSRNARSSINNDRKDKPSTIKRNDHKPLNEKKDWNSYLEKTPNKKTLLTDDDSSVSEISQDSFGFDEVVPFEDPFQKHAGTTDEFNPFGLDDIPQPMDSSKKQRPLKEKRGIGRLGNRTTKAKLDVKAAKKIYSKEKTIDDNDETSESVNNNDEDDDESEESGLKSNSTLGRNRRLLSSSRTTMQRGESFKRSKSTDVDQHSSHGTKYSPDRRQSSNKQQKEIQGNNDEKDDGLADDGFSLTYVAKRDGVRSTLQRDESFNSRKSTGKSSVKRDGVRGTIQRDESFNSRKSSTKNSDSRVSSSLHNRTSSMSDRNYRTATRNTSPTRRLEGSMHGGKSKYSDCDKYSSATVTSSSRKEADMELNPERLSPQRQVKSFRDKSKSLHARNFPPIDRYDDYEARSFRENSNDDRNDIAIADRKSSHHASESIQTRKSMHTRKPPNSLDPSSAQSRFFGGSGESKIKVRTKPNTTSSSTIRLSNHPVEKQGSSNGNNNDTNMDRSDHSKQSYVSNASTKMSTESLLSSNSKVSSSRRQGKSLQRDHHRSSSGSNNNNNNNNANTNNFSNGGTGSSQHTRKLQMIKKLPNGNNNSSSQLNYYD